VHSLLCGHRSSHPERCDKAARIRRSLTRYIERCAVVDGCSYDRQPECDVHGCAESCVLEDRQTLVVVHREYSVFVSGAWRKSRVRGQWASDFFSATGEFRDDGRYNAVIFVAEVATFTCMWIQPTNDDFRIRDTEAPAKVVKQYLDDCLQSLGRDCRGNIFQRQMCRRQGDTQVPGGKQHDGQRTLANICKELGVPGKREAGVVDDTFMQGRRYDPAEVTVNGALNSIAQAVE
jgi:hypothetical protein